MQENNIKGQVRQFYDQVGWQMAGEGLYQNARYEDLRSVSREYIHRCHMRVKRHLAKSGDYLLDAGSGPVQYPEYLTYSEGYKRRVCMDISIVALKEARGRLGEKGLYVVADIAKLPFKLEVFDGIVSLHTIHHLPMEEKVAAYENLYKRLRPGRTMVTVDGWTLSPWMTRMTLLMRIADRLNSKQAKKLEVDATLLKEDPASIDDESVVEKTKEKPVGTFVHKIDANWLKKALQGRVPFRILVWRSVSVRFLRSMIQPAWGGRFWLKVLYRLEEWFPRFFGEKGQYPLIVMKKPESVEV